MSVNKDDIDFNKAFEKSLGAKSKQPASKIADKKDVDFNKAFENSLKKKGTSEPSATGSEDVPDGAAPGTTSTTKPDPIKWEDNPLNPASVKFKPEVEPGKPASILFKEEDDVKVKDLVQKYNVPLATDVEIVPANNALNPTLRQYKSVPKNPVSVAIDYANNIEATIKEKIANVDKRAAALKNHYSLDMVKEKQQLEQDLAEVKLLKDKAAARLVPSGDKEIEAVVRVADATNSFERAVAWFEPDEATKPVDTKQKLSPQFVTGYNATKYTEPVIWERISEALRTGRPISDSQVAAITALGAKIDAAKLEESFEKIQTAIAVDKNKFDQYSNQLTKVKADLDGYETAIKSGKKLSPAEAEDYKTKVSEYNALVVEVKPIQDKLVAANEEFSKKAEALKKVSEDNLLNRPEVLRAFFADNIGNYLHDIGRAKQAAGEAGNSTLITANYFTGHTWNYSDKEIAGAAAEIAKREGLDIKDPRIQNVIKELQVNEGWMFGMNSIPKSGGGREFAGGAVKYIKPVAGLRETLTTSADDLYIESQSQGNLDVAQKRLESEEKGVRGVVNTIVAGAGEFGTQALLMYGASGIAGGIGKTILGRAGTAAIAGDIAVADMGAVNLIGKALLKFKDPIGVYTTTKAMSYESALKSALSYTADNDKALATAYILSDLEAYTELFLSPLDIAKGIVRKFSRAETTNLMKILEDKSLKNDPSKLSAYIQKFIKGAASTGYVAAAEMGEEEITQLGDYLANQYLNPNSKAFQNRDLQKELIETAYQTGLTMAVPALLNGIGAAQANTFSKGALLVASQNRQKIIDGLSQDLFDKKIDQQTFNTKARLVNTAATAHSQLPKKANGADLNTDEKANYIWSRVTEAYMDNKVASISDAAEKEIWKDKILKQQEYRKGILGLKDEVPEAPEYTIDGKPVSREEFLRTIEEKPDGNYVVTGDEEAREALRKVGGIDDKTDSEVASAVIEIGGKTYEGKNHAEAILKAKADGQDISKVDRKGQGKFKLADGTIIDRAEAKKRYGADRAEQLIEQDEAADNANKEYRKSDKDLVNEVEEKGVPGYEKTSIKELKEQALQAPDSFKNQFDDEELVVDLIARNTPEQIEDAIAYQQQRLEDPNIDEAGIIGIDAHIVLLEQGLKKQKEFAEVPPHTEVKGKDVVVDAKNISDGVDTKGLDKKLPAYQANTRTEATKELIAFAEKVFDSKFEGDFNKGEYVSWFQSLGKEGYAASELLNSPKKALEALKDSPTYQAKIKEKSKPDVVVDEGVRLRTEDEVKKIKQRNQKLIDNNNKIVELTGKDNAGEALDALGGIYRAKVDEANANAKKRYKEGMSIEEKNKIVDEEFEKSGVGEIDRLINHLNDTNDTNSFKTTSLTQEAKDIQKESDEAHTKKVRVKSDQSLSTPKSKPVDEVVVDKDLKRVDVYPEIKKPIKPSYEEISKAFDIKEFDKEDSFWQPTKKKATEIMDWLKESKYTTEYEKELLSKYKEHIDKNLSISFDPSLPINKGGGVVYNSKGEFVELRINPKNITHQGTTTTVQGTILHEITHFLVKKGERQLYDKVSPLFDLANKYISENKKSLVEQYGNEHAITYGLSGINEFVAEAMSNRQFQTILSKINYKSESKSVWQKFTDTIKDYFSKLLGTNDNNVLNEVVKSITQHISENNSFKEQSLSTPKSKPVDEGVVDKPLTKLEQLKAKKKAAKAEVAPTDNPKPVKSKKEPVAETENDIIQKWLDKEYENLDGADIEDGYVSFDWDGKILEIFQGRNKAPLEFTRDELIEQGVELPAEKQEPDKKPADKGESVLAYDETETEAIKALTGKRINIGDYTGIVTFASVEKGKFELHDEKGQIKKVHFKDSELVDEKDVPVTVVKKKEKPTEEDNAPEFPDEKRHTDSVMPAYRFEDVSDETLDKIIADFNKSQEDGEDHINRKTREEKITAISGEYLRSKAWKENPEFIKAVEDAVQKKPKNTYRPRVIKIGSLNDSSPRTRAFLAQLNNYPEMYSGFTEYPEGGDNIEGITNQGAAKMGKLKPGVQFSFYNPSTKIESKYYVEGNAEKMITAAEDHLNKVSEFDKNKNKQNEQPTKKQQTPGEGPGKSSTKSGKGPKPEKIKIFKKRAKATIKSPLYLKALDIESNEPRVLALQYFIAGGRIHRQALEKLFGGNKVSGRKNVEEEIKAHFQLQGRHGARSIDQLAHDLWDETDEIAQEKFDSQDFSNAVESVLLDHNSRTSMAEELAKYEEKDEDAFQKYYDQAHENLDEDEQNQVDKAISILEGLSDEEIQQILDTEAEALADGDFLEQLSNQYDKVEISQADIDRAEKDKKIAEIQKEKQDKINKATKPDIQPEQTGLEIEDLAATSEANRQQHTDIKQKMYSLRELINCLWA